MVWASMDQKMEGYLSSNQTINNR